MYYFGLLAHSNGSVTQLFSSETVEEAIAIFLHIAEKIHANPMTLICG